MIFVKQRFYKYRYGDIHITNDIYVNNKLHTLAVGDVNVRSVIERIENQ